MIDISVYDDAGQAALYEQLRGWGLSHGGTERVRVWLSERDRNRDRAVRSAQIRALTHTGKNARKAPALLDYADRIDRGEDDAMDGP